MLKILYAASNNENAKIQLSRFQQIMEGKPYVLKIAAYKKSSPNINIDWTLDCLHNIFKPEHITLDNDNYNTYFEQVKYYNPDLIISDMEYFTSHIANELDISLWQCSSSLINFALTNDYKYNLGVFKRYAYLFGKSPAQVKRLNEIIGKSNCNLVYSHFGDTETPPPLKEDYEWVRPYHTTGKISVPCQHNVVAGALGSNKDMLRLLKQYADSVYFTEFVGEKYANPAMKDIRNVEEFACNLRNSRLFMCEGQTSFLADAFYNNRYSIVMPDLQDTECVVNSTISEKLGLSTSIYQSSQDLDQWMDLQVPVKLGNIKYLHERIEEL